MSERERERDGVEERENVGWERITCECVLSLSTYLLSPTPFSSSLFSLSLSAFSSFSLLARCFTPLHSSDWGRYVCLEQ